MCDVCLHSPCLPGCPNEPPPPIVYTCVNCQEPIYEGDDYYDIEGDAWCEECIRDALKIAELEDWYDEEDYDDR